MNKFILPILFILGLIVVAQASEIKVLGTNEVNRTINLVTPSSPSGGGGNSSFNETTGNSLWWRLDGTNAPPTADWNMGGKGFKNVGESNFNGSINFFHPTSNSIGLFFDNGNAELDYNSGADHFEFSGLGDLNFDWNGGYAFNTGQAIFYENLTAPNLCYSNGSNCMSSAGGNASWNESRANGLYSSIIWGYNQTIPAIDVAQNYTQTYYASQGYRQTICFSMGNLANTGYLSFGGLVHTATSSFLALHNGSILGSTSSWRQSGAAIIAGNEVNATLNLTINGVSTISNNILNVATGSTGQFINDATRNQYTFTRGSNISVLYTKLLGTGSVGFPSYCVEYVYDQ